MMGYLRYCAAKMRWWWEMPVLAHYYSDDRPEYQDRDRFDADTKAWLARMPHREDFT